MTFLKRSVLLACVVSTFLGAAPSLHADVVMDDATKKATAKALEWLASKQNADGSFSDGGYSHNTAITSFAVLAFMSQGHLPNQGQYGPEVTKAAKYLMASQRPEDGYLVGARGGNMYCHGMATLALSELWGQTGDDEIKPVLTKAVELIIKSQNPQGGWRYDPSPTGADISVTIMQVMALRSANSNGLHVPEATLKRAIDYIKSCYRPTVGGFTYQPNSGAPGFARTAAGLCVLYLTGKHEIAKKDYEPAFKYLEQNFEAPIHFYYGQYYAVHAMYQVGGERWENWYKRVNDYFMTRQSPDGSWAQTNRREVGPVFQTSIAVIALSAPAHYLPIFQR